MLYAPVGASMVTELVVTAQRRHESIESVPVARIQAYADLAYARAAVRIDSGRPR